MDRTAYLKIRSSLNLERQASALGLHLLQDAALVAVIYGLSTQYSDSWVQFLASPLLFVLIFRGFGIMHEAVHGTVSKNKFMNDFVGILGGGLCLLPYETWKKSHISHHQWSGNIEKDSVMAFILAYPKLSPRFQNFISKTWQMWLPILAVIQHTVFWMISLKMYAQQKTSWKMAVSLITPLALWSAVLMNAKPAFALGVFLPAMLMYFVAIEIVNLPHHLQLPHLSGDEKFPAWQQYKTARSCIYPKWFARFVVLNFNFHIEHHMFPDAPWYHLDKLHALVKEELKDEYNSDPYFAWISENKKKDVSMVLASAEVKKVEKYDKAA